MPRAPAGRISLGLALLPRLASLLPLGLDETGNGGVDPGCSQAVLCRVPCVLCLCCWCPWSLRGLHSPEAQLQVGQWCQGGQGAVRAGVDHPVSLAEGLLQGRHVPGLLLAAPLQSCGRSQPVLSLSCEGQPRLRASGHGRATGQPELLRPSQLSELPCKTCPQSSRLVPCSCCPSSFLKLRYAQE